VTDVVEIEDTADIDSTAALVWVSGRVDSFLPTVASLRASHPTLRILVGGATDASHSFDSWGVVQCASPSFNNAVALACGPGARSVLVVSAPVVVPPRFLDLAITGLADDLRIATISFLSNAAGCLSVPSRNTPVMHQVGPHDEVSITRRLRELEPAPVIAPIAAPVGAVTLLSLSALDAVGGFDESLGWSVESQIAEFGLRAGDRGFVNTVDGGTYCTRAFDLAPYLPGPLEDIGSGAHQNLALRYPGALLRYDDDICRADSPLGLMIQTSAAKILGLRIIVDGRDIGPKEMGTQVQILSLVRELSLRDDVESVQLAMPGEIPQYAMPYLQSAKVSVFHSRDHDMTGAATADVIHRPSQPSSAIPFETWRQRASRVIVTLQDLIAYQVEAYFETASAWMSYRSNLVDGVAAADGVIVISKDTQRHVRAEQLPVERDRVFVVPNGTDHLTGLEPEVCPRELAARGFVDQQFILVMGTNYGHKNRDLAIRAWQLLRSDHPDLTLVLAGAFVPNGSSRTSETKARAGGDDGLFVLPDVMSDERNWLLRHAQLVMYPTSAEGFGLVPFEAARFGTPTVGVRFGPVSDFNPDAPVWADTWSPNALATAAARLLNDTNLCSEQVRATLKNGEHLRWADTAAGLVRSYRTALSLPARWNNTR